MKSKALGRERPALHAHRQALGRIDPCPLAQASARRACFPVNHWLLFVSFCEIIYKYVKNSELNLVTVQNRKKKTLLKSTVFSLTVNSVFLISFSYIYNWYGIHYKISTKTIYFQKHKHYVFTAMQTYDLVICFLEEA